MTLQNTLMETTLFIVLCASTVTADIKSDSLFAKKQHHEKMIKYGVYYSVPVFILGGWGLFENCLHCEYKGLRSDIGMGFAILYAASFFPAVGYFVYHKVKLNGIKRRLSLVPEFNQIKLNIEF